MEAKGGRNFANGKQMFTVATCVACHKFGGQGNEFGPDLAKLDPKVFKNAVDVLEHILEPGASGSRTSTRCTASSSTPRRSSRR